MFDFVLHLHCIILFILQFSMFCIFFWCSKSFLLSTFPVESWTTRSTPKPRSNDPQTWWHVDMPWMPRYASGHGGKDSSSKSCFFCEKCWEKLLFYFTNLYLYLLDSPPCLLEFLSRPTPPPPLSTGSRQVTKSPVEPRLFHPHGLLQRRRSPRLVMSAENWIS